MRITLFGGSFDPPHFGHIGMAAHLLSTNSADQVWFVPCHQHPFAKQLSPASDRVAMLQLLLQPNMAVCSWELEQSQPSYSLTTLREQRQRYPEHTFSWLLGSDQVESFSRWYKWQELLHEFVVYVYPRTVPMPPLLPGMQPLENAPVLDFSSSQVRAMRKQQLPVSHLVGEKVNAYLQQHRVYSEDHVAA